MNTLLAPIDTNLHILLNSHLRCHKTEVLIKKHHLLSVADSNMLFRWNQHIYGHWPNPDLFQAFEMSKSHHYAPK